MPKGIIENESQWNAFVKREHLDEHKIVPIRRAHLHGWKRFALITLRIYIISILIIVILGFLNII